MPGGFGATFVFDSAPRARAGPCQVGGRGSPPAPPAGRGWGDAAAPPHSPLSFSLHFLLFTRV